MPSPIPIPVREAVYQRWQQGQASSEIAEPLNLARRSVRNLIKRFREKGSAAISTSYHRAGTKMSAAQKEAREAAEQMRREHPGWGSIVIRIMLLKQADKLLPSARTFRRWFAQSGLGPAAKGERPASRSSRAERPHEVWQMDASEEIALKDGSRVSWLRIVDEFTGAVFMTRVFSRGPI